MRLSFQKSLRRPTWLGASTGCVALWTTGVVVLEIGGRELRGDSGDFVALLLLGAYALATIVWHVHRPIPIVTRAARWTRIRLRRASNGLPDFAVDFRKTPPIPAGFPSPLLGGVVGLAALAPALALLSGALPGGLREGVSTVSYTLWIVLLGGLWTALAAGLALLSMYSLRVVHSFGAELGPPGAPNADRVGQALGLGYLFGVLVGLLFLPDWFGFAMLGALLTIDVALLHLPGNSSVTLLWWVDGPEGRSPRSVESHRAIALQVGLLVFLAADLTLVARGEHLGFGILQVAEPSTTFTNGLGSLLLWSAVGAMTIGTLQIARFVRLSRSLVVRPKDRPRLVVEGAPPAGVQQRLRRRLGALGWNATFDSGVPGGVRVRLGSEAASLDEFDFFERWPLPVAEADLERADVQRKLARRLEIVRRRGLIKGVRKLFKAAARLGGRGGGGYWLGIQHWFEPGMSRDGGTERGTRGVLDPIVGPPFVKVFSRDVRRYFGQVMTALEIDLVFVEDGVRFRAFEHVLRTMFETYDVHGGAQRLEEMHFVGLSGLRVVIHDHSPGSVVESASGYPEPDYEDIARARILHVFRDRGGEEARWEVPDFFSGLPVPIEMR